jgi:chromosome segregation ATPase
VKEDRIRELKMEHDSLKSENGTMNSLIMSLRTKIKELEGDLGGYESVASKSGITISSLQRDNRELQQTVCDLESRIRTLVMDREEAERKTDSVNNKLIELSTKITTITGFEINPCVDSLDILVCKINEISDENSMLKGRLMTMSEKFSGQESENISNRETIQRLVNELSRLEKDSLTFTTEKDKIRAVNIPLFF